MLLAAVATVVGTGCGNGKLDPNHVKTSCDRFGASDDRTALAYLDGKKLIVRTAQGTRSLARPACMKERVKELYVAPGGVAVGAYGNESAVAGDLWGHSGKRTTVECMVDMASGRESKLDVVEAFAWSGAEAVVIPEAKLPLGPANCKVATTSSGAIAACVDRDEIKVRRYRGHEMEAVGQDVHVPGGFMQGGRVEDLAISPDGRLLATWSPSFKVIELSSGKPLLARDDVGKISAVELDPTGGDRVMLIGPPYEGTSEPTRRIQILGLDGKLLHTGSERGADRVVYWTEPAAYWSTHSCGADRVELPR